MHQLIAILAAAFGFMTGGHALQPGDASPPIGMAKLSVQHPADAISPIEMGKKVHPADAIPPIGM